MIWIIYLFIALWVIIGVLALFVPRTAKGFVMKISHSGPFWLWGIIALVMGYLFWQSTALVSIDLVMQTLAVVAIIKGLTFLFMPKRIINGLLNCWKQVPDIIFRVIGLVLLIFSYCLFQILV